MAEKHHVKTVPGEHVAPEFVPQPVHHEAGAHTQAEDVNVSLVAILGLFFGALLLVTLVALQAWFYNRADAELERKTAPQGAPGSELAVAHDYWQSYLTAQGPKKDPADVTGAKSIHVIPIEQAMRDIAAQYGKAGGTP